MTSSSVFIPQPFGLVSQWLRSQRWSQNEPSLEKQLEVGLNDWEGRWSMLLWISERVHEDHQVASAEPRDYLRDVSLEYHLSYWFITARLCYDTIAFVTLQLSAERDRGKLPVDSFNKLLNQTPRDSLQPVTNALIDIALKSKDTFEELKHIRDSLVHFVGSSANNVNPPRRINVGIVNKGGVTFTVEASRFADFYKSVRDWDLLSTVRNHFRQIYELSSFLECAFLDHVASERIPGSYRGMSADIFDFLDCESIDDHSQAKWTTRPEP